MGVSSMNATTKREGSPLPNNDGGSGSVPSGFILKLFQMVNGAPDELISVSEVNVDSLEYFLDCTILLAVLGSDLRSCVF